MRQDTIRPAFHITGQKGWINDPNGLVKFNGEYHVFFQHYSEKVYWGPMHWGHVKSRDLLHWEHLPVALCPDEQDDGCFSGTAIVWKNKLWLFYTSFKENGGGESVRQLQALASSDNGVDFIKHGIVIGEKDLPDAYTPCDFRDPKIFMQDDTFYCLVAARKRDGRGRILMFSSKNLFDWTFCSDLFGLDSGGIMIECPDYCSDLGLLTYCEQFQPAEGRKHLNIHSTFYRLGNIDCKSARARFGKNEIIDYGFDFYAAQIFGDTPVMIGWLSMWDRNTPYDKYGFAGMLTVPRKLSVIDGKLLQEPLYCGKKIAESLSPAIADKTVCGVIEISVEELKELTLKLRVKGGNRTLITVTENRLIFDRSRSGEEITGKESDEYSVAGIREMPLDKRRLHKLIVVMDLFSVEIFADGKSLSSVICPPLDADGIELSADAASCKYVRYDVSDCMGIK
ncbi:MAG: glycoside hydrolase family 32 protein [Clostridia bacterium]|jgi:beta-fructofuranosidase|nr:glycoside hydrolase family 32 protein [Clostridia bacterium]